MSNMYDKALEIATAAHRNQKDKSGEDYIKHPVTVASFVSGEDAKVVALLHDVLEDTDVTEAELRAIFGYHYRCRCHDDTQRWGTLHVLY